MVMYTSGSPLPPVPSPDLPQNNQKKKVSVGSQVGLDGPQKKLCEIPRPTCVHLMGKIPSSEVLATTLRVSKLTFRFKPLDLLAFAYF